MVQLRMKNTLVSLDRCMGDLDSYINSAQVNVHKTRLLHGLKQRRMTAFR